jgi:uncharacterized protein YjbI with pentapeptide repeats
MGGEEEVLDGGEIDGLVFEDDVRGRRYSECTFVRCRFQGMALVDVVLSNCVFVDCAFRNVDVAGLRMQNTAFRSVVCVGIDWSEVRALGKLFPLFKEISGCVLQFNTFFKMKLSKLLFSDSKILDCSFMEANLAGSVFRGVDFLNSTFQDCDLTACDFREARNYRINTAANSMAGARFSLPEVVGLLDNLGVIIE